MAIQNRARFFSSLYAARQGNGFIGEDPTRVYLFRNFYSTEAQLGISDYSPTGTPAGNTEKPMQTLNLLASIDPSEDYMVFNKLTLLEDINGKPLPTILAKDELDQCVAFQPSDTLIIKQATQDTRYLTRLTSLPTGVSCE